MKNKGLIFIILVVLFFGFIFFFSVNKEKEKEQEENRILLITNMENYNDLGILGDYLVKVNFDKNSYKLYPLEKNLVLENDGDHDFAKKYKEEDFDLYVKLLENNFDIKINEFIKFEKKGIKTNINKEIKPLYLKSLSKFKEIKDVLEGNYKNYNPQDNQIYLRIFSYFSIDTNGIFNKKILKENANKIVNHPSYEKEFYLSLLEFEKIKLHCQKDYCIYEKKENY